MQETAKTLKQFFGGFGIPAYAEDSVPDDVDIPYLTYPLVEPEWQKQASFYVQGWYKATGYAEMIEKCDQITREIGDGIIVSTDKGYIVLRPETPKVQFRTDQNKDVKVFYINLSLNSYHMPGV